MENKFFLAFTAFAGVPVLIGAITTAILWAYSPTPEMSWTFRALLGLLLFIGYKAWQEARKP
jgi:hypothetical protein